MGPKGVKEEEGAGERKRVRGGLGGCGGGPEQQGGESRRKRSEGAPVPVAGDAGGDVEIGGGRVGAWIDDGDGGRGQGPWGGTGGGIGGVGGRREGEGVGVVEGAAGGQHRLGLLEAVGAGAEEGAAGVKVGVLVEGEDVAGVPGAEDVAAFATVVAANEVAEAALTCGIVADGGLVIGLWRERNGEE